MPYGDKCLYSYRYVLGAAGGARLGRSRVMTSSSARSACDRKPAAGFKPLTPPSTPVSPCGPGSTAGAQTPTPPHPRVANPNTGPRPAHLQQPMTAGACPPHRQAVHSPPFAVPCVPVGQDANSFTPEHR